MNKPSDRLDYVDKGMEIYNFYIQNEIQKFKDEIIWLDCNSRNIHELRLYLATFLGEERASQLSNEDVTELITIRANDLYNRCLKLSRQKIDSTPLKVIVQALKLNDH